MSVFWSGFFAGVVVCCIVGFIAFALLDSAKLSGADQERDEHEQGGP